MAKTLRIFKTGGAILSIFLEIFIGLLTVYFILFVWGLIFYCGSITVDGETTIFVRSNGVHTEICMPVQERWKNWSDFIPLKDYAGTSQANYIAIGWGDKGFFLDTPIWAELKVSTALNAVFLPSSAAMHVEYCTRPEPSEVCKRVNISKKQYKLLCDHIESCFDLKHGKVQLIEGYGYGLTDNFYEAHGSYHLFSTCNVWTNNALKSADIRTSIFSPFPEGNLIHL